MNCLDLENVAVDYADGTLSGAQRSALESHMAVCMACAARMRQFAGGLASLSQTLELWPAVEPSPVFDRRVLQSIRAERPARSLAGRQAAAPEISKSFFASLFTPSSALWRPALAGALSMMLVGAVAVLRFYPDGAALTHSGQTGNVVVATLDNNWDEFALYQDLPVLEDLDMLRNFDVLQDVSQEVFQGISQEASQDAGQHPSQ